MSAVLADALARAASLQITGKTEEALWELLSAKGAGHQSPKLFDAIGHLQFELGQFHSAASGS